MQHHASGAFMAWDTENENKRKAVGRNSSHVSGTIKGNLEIITWAQMIKRGIDIFQKEKKRSLTFFTSKFDARKHGAIGGRSCISSITGI
eukprot:15364924-Ditylum_brightwellii.AAC.1